MKKKLSVALAAAMVALLPASAALADGHEAEVIIVHGVPGFTADILVNGDVVFPGVEFGTIADASLPAGSYDLAVNEAGTATTVLFADDVALEAGMSYSVVAGLDTDGEAKLFLTANETGEGEGIQVSHFANFGAVDITPTDVTGLAGVENGGTGFVATGAGDVAGLGVAAAGADENAIDLDTVTVPEGEAVLVFAIGPDVEAALPTLEVTTISVAVDEEPEPEPENGEEEVDEDADEDAEEEVEQPTHVDSGTGGLLNAGLPVWVAALMIMGALGIAAPAVATARRRS